MTPEALVLDLLSILTCVVWLCVFFWMLPMAEKRTPGFLDYLAKECGGNWIFALSSIMTMVSFGMLAKVVCGWIGLGDAGSFTVTVVVQVAFLWWLRYAATGKVWGGGIF